MWNITAAHIVDQRLRSRSRSPPRTRPRHYLRPRDRRVVRAERRPRAQEPELRAANTSPSTAPTTRPRPCRAARRRSAASAAPRSAGRSTSAPAATIAYVTVIPWRPAAPARRCWAGSAPDGCRSAPHPAPTDGRSRRRRDHRDARHPPLGQHPMGHVQAERRLAGRGIDARNASFEDSNTWAAATCCRLRSRRAVGRGGRERPAAERGRASISYVTGRVRLGGLIGRVSHWFALRSGNISQRRARPRPGGRADCG